MRRTMRGGRMFAAVVGGKSRRFICGLVIVALAATVSVASPAQATEPLRSGTIVGGAYLVPMALAPGWVPPCSLTVDCAAWVAADCDPRLAGRDPGVSTAIVDIGKFAGTKRSLWRSAIGWASYGRVELWTENCLYLGPRPYSDRWEVVVHNPVRFRVPAEARWMTVTAAAPALSWELW